MRRATLPIPLHLILACGCWLGAAGQPKLDFSTTLGGYGSTGANAVALDAGGNMFVAADRSADEISNLLS